MTIATHWRIHTCDDTSDLGAFHEVDQAPIEIRITILTEGQISQVGTLGKRDNTGEPVTGERGEVNRGAVNAKPTKNNAHSGQVYIPCTGHRAVSPCVGYFCNIESCVRVTSSLPSPRMRTERHHPYIHTYIHTHTHTHKYTHTPTQAAP
jgi:hypothetical protein